MKTLLTPDWSHDLGHPSVFSMATVVCWVEDDIITASCGISSYTKRVPTAVEKEGGTRYHQARRVESTWNHTVKTRLAPSTAGCKYSGGTTEPKAGGPKVLNWLCSLWFGRVPHFTNHDASQCGRLLADITELAVPPSVLHCPVTLCSKRCDGASFDSEKAHILALTSQCWW